MAARILIVEDDLFIRELYEQILREAGFDVSIAKNGEEGLAKIQEGGYDLVLMDIIMPRLDGISVLKSLIQTPPIVPNKKIVILSALQDERYINEAFRYGAFGFMLKSSLTPGQIIERVKEFLATPEQVLPPPQQTVPDTQSKDH